MRFLHPKEWHKASGFSHGVSVPTGRTVVVAGQIGWNGDYVIENGDFVAQAKKALENIVRVLLEAEARPEHVVLLRWFVTDCGEYLQRLHELGTAYRSVMGSHYPAMTLVEVRGLVDEKAKVEIEAMAVVPEVA